MLLLGSAMLLWLLKISTRYRMAWILCSARKRARLSILHVARSQWIPRRLICDIEMASLDAQLAVVFRLTKFYALSAKENINALWDLEQIVVSTKSSFLKSKISRFQAFRIGGQAIFTILRYFPAIFFLRTRMKFRPILQLRMRRKLREIAALYLKSMRLYLNLNPSEMASSLCLSGQALSKKDIVRLESGRHPIPFPILVKAAKSAGFDFELVTLLNQLLVRKVCWQSSGERHYQTLVRLQRYSQKRVRRLSKRHALDYT